MWHLRYKHVKLVYASWLITSFKKVKLGIRPLLEPKLQDRGEWPGGKDIFDSGKPYPQKRPHNPYSTRIINLLNRGGGPPKQASHAVIEALPYKTIFVHNFRLVRPSWWMLDTVLCVSNRHMKALSVTVNTTAWPQFYAMFPMLMSCRGRRLRGVLNKLLAKRVSRNSWWSSIKYEKIQEVVYRNVRGFWFSSRWQEIFGHQVPFVVRLLLWALERERDAESGKAGICYKREWAKGRHGYYLDSGLSFNADIVENAGFDSLAIEIYRLP